MEVIILAYFLKKTNTKKGLYLQIYDSSYDPWRGHTVHTACRVIGYHQNLVKSGIADPLTHYQEEVDEMNYKNNERKQKDKIKLITDETPEKYLGYFPLLNINNALKIEGYIKLLQTPYDLQYSLFDMMSSLIYARAVSPCSKLKTFNEVLPRLYTKSDFSLDQVYSGLEILGVEYEKIIEIYNHQIQQKYQFNTDTTYFDCTNFYFEIDKEKGIKMRGPSKELKKDPIVSLGLLLDANQIPIGMNIFAGNESEKPILREVIDDLKSRNSITGKTVQVADKGLNCAENILHAKRDGDGYIFSKSVKMLPEIEKTWVLLKNDYKEVKDSNKEVIYLYKECIDKFPYPYIDESGKRKKILLTEKRVITYSPSLATKKRYEINRQVEKAKKLSSYNAKRNEYGDSAKYVNFKSSNNDGEVTEEKVVVTINQKAIDKDLELAGYNLFVTSETKMSATDIYNTYHNLWRIEESFKLMKSQLDARPVFLQKDDNIIGHFLICYLAVLFIRLIQFKYLDNKYSSEDIIKFIKEFKLVKFSSNKSINITKSSDFIKSLARSTRLPLTSYFLLDSQVKKMMDFRM